MSVQNVRVLVPPLPAVPPGAAWAAAAVVWLFGGDPSRPTGLPAWFAETRIRHRVARAARRDARERMALIAMARRFESSQPEFAKDLYAAARFDRQD